MSNNDGVISRHELAIELNVSRQWIIKLIKNGVIPVNPDNTIPRRAALEAYSAYQEQQAAKKEERQAAKMIRGKSAAPARAVPNIEESVNNGMTYSKAKTAKEAYAAKLKELEYKEKIGELVKKEDIERMATDLAEKVRGKLMTVGVRIAGLCEGRTAREIEELIDTEINAALADLRKDWLKNG